MSATLPTPRPPSPVKISNIATPGRHCGWRATAPSGYKYEEKHADLAAERERIRWRTFDMNMMTFIEMNRTLLGVPPLEKSVSGLNDDRKE